MSAAPERRRDDASHAPRLAEHEERALERSRAPAAPVIHEVIRAAGEEELARPVSALLWSGFAAGLSMGFSLVTEGLLRAHLPADAQWAPLVTRLGYSVGFLVVILGRQQLFTENTLTAVLPLLAHRDRATLWRMLRLWGLVLASNLVGALVIAYALKEPAAFDAPVRAQFEELARAAASHSAGTAIVRGIFAGWLIALMVWMLPGAQTARVPIIILLTWLVGTANLTHIVAGSVEVFHYAALGGIGWGAVFGRFVGPTLLGNVLGGVSLVAAVNHAQVVAGQTPGE